MKPIRDNSFIVLSIKPKFFTFVSDKFLSSDSLLTMVNVLFKFNLLYDMKSLNSKVRIYLTVLDYFIDPLSAMFVL